MKLITERIYLRPVVAEDAPLFLNHTKDEEIRYMTGTKARFSLEQIQKHIEQIQKDEARYDFTICLNAMDQLIGELSVLDIDLDNQSAGFRITMNAMQLTGKGYGTEAMALVLKFVFDELKLNRLQLEVFSHNERGIRAYEKNGFKREGVLREALHYNGAFSDEIIMAIIRSDYQKAKA
ncbi:GNAT family N-acetyltransferase [Planococcus sp. SSTMD024]|uniref:GNAT family N-acetyltransferase n=1 Tax=Planococcus sp. SSTMD024 TaxID=3242163 RepID=UPI00351EC615